MSTDGTLTLNFRRQQPSTRPVSAVSTSQIESRASRDLPGCFDWGKDPYENASISGTGNGSNQATMTPGHISKQLRHIARRLMWYPICKFMDGRPLSLLCPSVYFRVMFSVHSGRCPRVCVSDGSSCGVATTFRSASLRWNLLWR